MSYHMHILLDNEYSPDMDIYSFKEILAKEYLKTWLGERPSMEYSRVPFGPRSKYDSLILRWSDTWWISIDFETIDTNENVKQDIEYIAHKCLNQERASTISKMTRRIVFLTKADPAPEYAHTDYIIELMAFFENIPGTVIFDPKNDKIIYA